MAESLCEFGVVEEECPFCGQDRTVLFDEHFYFCPNCTTIYTFPILEKTECDHLPKDPPLVLRLGNKKRWKPEVEPYAIEGEMSAECSVCGLATTFGGW